MNKEDDIVIEDDPDSTSVESERKKLREKLKMAEAKAKEYLDGWQRSQADFVNLRKRDEEAKAEFLKFAKADIIIQLLPVLDSLSLSGSHGEIIYKQFMQILRQNGLEEDIPLGEEFDPKLHEALGTIESEEDHKILEVVQKGYILSGKIIRPAKVKIGELKQ